VTLVERPVRSIVRAVADAAARWRNADFPPRVRALAAVCERTGYSIPVVEYALDRLFGSLQRTDIEEIIAVELGSPDVLDGAVDTTGGASVRALPVGRVCIVSSRTTIGVAIVPAIFALCAKCDVLVKDRDDALVAAFFSTLAHEMDDLATAAVARTWDGKGETHNLRDFAAVVAFGTDTTLERIRAQLSPQARWIPFGSKASFGYVAREACCDANETRRVADGAARDLLLYDGEGCLSLHVLFIERGGTVSPADFVAMLAHAIERGALAFPPSRPNAAASAAVAGARDAASFRASAGKGGAVFSDASASYVVMLDPTRDAPPTFLPRVLPVYAVDEPGDAARYLARHALSIEGVAIAGLRPDVAAMVRASGAASIVQFGDLQSPALRARHGGRPRIAEFVRWLTQQS